MEFRGGGANSTNLTLAYTTPGSNGSNRSPVWSGKFSTGRSEEHIHSLGFAINTANDGTGWLEFYLDGVKQKFNNGKTRLSNIYLYTGETFPKFGIYRAERNDGSRDPADWHTFNSCVY